MNPSGADVIMSDCHGTGQGFDFRLGNVHTTYHAFGVDKISTKLAWELNTEGPALGRPPDRDIC